jgi:hypothetical protein
VAGRNAALPSVFLGFRQREGLDADLNAPYAGATSVYTWQGQGFHDYYETYLQVPLQRLSQETQMTVCS